MADFEIKPKTEKDLTLESKKLDLESGWLGRVFGAPKSAPLNIAGTLVLLLTLSGVSTLFISTSIQAGEYWKIIIPLLTLVMGYVFGRGGKNDDG